MVAAQGEGAEPLAEARAALCLEVVVAPGYSTGARRILAAKANLRLLVDEGLAVERQLGGVRAAPGPTGSLRSAGGRT